MSSHFPIFVNVLSAPPLVIGDSDVLTPKIRLLLKIGLVVDVVATLPSPSALTNFLMDAALAMHGAYVILALLADLLPVVI